jgi:hypothetical protein
MALRNLTLWQIISPMVRESGPIIPSCQYTFDFWEMLDVPLSKATAWSFSSFDKENGDCTSFSRTNEARNIALKFALSSISSTSTLLTGRFDGGHTTAVLLDEGLNSPGQDYLEQSSEAIFESGERDDAETDYGEVLCCRDWRVVLQELGEWGWYC